MAPEVTEKKGFFYRLQHCDPRYIYLFFFLTVAAFVVISERTKIKMPIPLPAPVQKLYDTIEDAPSDKIVIVESNWGVNIRAESEGQMRAVFEHLMRKKVKFAILSWVGNPQGQKNGYDIAANVAQKYGYEYGKDWVAWAGLKKTGGAVLQALAKDIHETVKADANGKPLNEIEMMKNVHTIYDVYLIYSVSYNWEDTAWLGFIQGVYGTNYAIAVSAITSSTAYSFLETDQICGMLAGAPGAAAYEELLMKDNRKYDQAFELTEEKRFAKKKVIILSMAISYIILAILLGNISYYSSRRREKTWRK